MKAKTPKMSRKEIVFWLVSCSIIASISGLFVFSEMDQSVLILAKGLFYPFGLLTIVFLYKLIRHVMEGRPHMLPSPDSMPIA